MASGGNKRELPPFLGLFFFFSQGSEVVNSVAGWQNEDGPTWRICLSLVFVVVDSGEKPPAAVVSAIFSFVSGSHVVQALVTSGRSDFHKYFLHVITLFYAVFLLVLLLLLFVFLLSLLLFQ